MTMKIDKTATAKARARQRLGIERLNEAIGFDPARMSDRQTGHSSVAAGANIATAEFAKARAGRRSLRKLSRRSRRRNRGARRR